MAPEIVDSDPKPGDSLLVDSDPTYVWVVVQDQNDVENLDYLWTISGEGPQPWEPLSNVGENQNIMGSMVKLARNPNHDGRTLQVQATDSFGATVVQEWEISVPEEAR